MRRVASLYLPFLPTDRLRRTSGSAAPPERSASLLPPMPAPDDPGPDGARVADCSCPRGGHWRPGARWAENSKERRARIAAEIEALPAHQRPPLRELGRRSEAAEGPFKRMRPDEGGARGGFVPPPPAAQDADALVTAMRDGQRLVVGAVCRNAAALGLYAGMPLTQARAMVPGLDVRDADPEADRALLERIGVFAARRVTPLVTISGPDGLWLDLTGVAHLHGGEQQTCVALLRFCAKLGLGARIAVAGNGAAAHALARHGSARIGLCADGGEIAALGPLPVEALRLAPRRVDTMRTLGIERIADLVAMTRAPLVRRFGAETLARLDQALGRAPEPIDPIVPRSAPMAELRFAEPIGDAGAIGQAIAALVAELCETLRAAGQGGRSWLLVCERVDKERQQLGLGTARATRDPAHLLRLIAMKIEAIDPGFGIDTMRLVAVATDPLGATDVPGDLAAPDAAPDLARLVDLLAGRIGPRNLYRLALRESDVPERSVRRVGPLEAPIPWPDRWPRPPRLLPRPEPIDHVIAELPDLPPKRFTWRGRTHRLVRGDGPERIYGEWWKQSGERDAVRDYFRVEDETGARFWLFRRGDGRDARTGDLSWWMQGGCG
jgi:protein ImuB